MQVGEDFLVDIVEQMSVGGRVEINVLFDGVDDLAKQRAGLHVVVGIFEHRADHAAMRGYACFGGKLLQGRKKVVVDEVDKFFAGHAFRVLGPVAPAKSAMQRRAVAGLCQLPLLFLVVEDFQEQQPADLTDALGIAIDAYIFAHDVLDGLDKGCK